jgi:hypothetical protein
VSPDLSSQRQLGLVACALALLVAIGMPVWASWDSTDSAARLEAAKKEVAAAKVAGSQPLQARVAQQRAANAAVLANIVELKTQTGFRTAPRYQIPSGSAEPGKFFSDLHSIVAGELQKKCVSKGIQFQEGIGFTKEVLKREENAEVAQELLNVLQLTEKALNTAISDHKDAPDPIESFKISHGKTDESGLPLLREYPIKLEVRCSLKRILWILHSVGTRVESEPPLILRGLSITSNNTKPKDDIQILDATFDLAAMAFPKTDSTGPALARPGSRPADPASAEMKARP